MTKMLDAVITNATIAETSSTGRVLAASVVGSVIEWYDYALYGTAAALIFGHLFFPATDPFVSMVGTFGTFAAGFVFRPLGGLVAGYYGDLLGGKATLVLTLMTMILATALIGCLSTYTQAGVWAPALLLVLRLLQGFAVGGEWGGAVLMAVEFAPPGRRGFWGSFPQIGPSAGIVLGTAASSAVSAFVAPADEAFRQHVLAKIKLGRLGRLEDITGAAIHLASDASALMTGASMVIDGG